MAEAAGKFQKIFPRAVSDRPRCRMGQREKRFVIVASVAGL